MKQSPPRWAAKLLTLFGDPNTLEEVQGDLLEMYGHWHKTWGSSGARWRYIFSVFKLLRPFAVRKGSELYPKTQTSSLDMIQNYLKIAFRNLAKHKGYSAINMGGLAVGMAVAILIGLWIYDELSFNKYHQNYDRIAEVKNSFTNKGETSFNNTQPYPLATELMTHYQGSFKHIVRASWVQDYILSAGENKVSRTGQFVDSGAPEMLTFKMLHGTRAGLNDTYSIMLSASTAAALFGNADPVNKLVRINNKTDVKVAGVFEDLPVSSQFKEIKFFCPFNMWEAENEWIKRDAAQDWGNHFIKIYAEILPDNSSDPFVSINARIKNAELKNLANFKDLAAMKPTVFLYPMRDWHLHKISRNGTDAGAMHMLWTIGIIGAFVLALACINFTNLTTARSEKRAKEVGIRKAVGSLRGQLLNQFFAESMLMVLISFAIALLLAVSSLSWFNEVAAKQMTIPWTDPAFWALSLGFVILTGLLAGSYPALFLSSFQPVKVLKGIAVSRIGIFNTAPRKVLVVLQFTVSVTLIICTLIVHRQLQFAKDRPVGYDRDGLLMVEMKSADFYNKYDLLRNELKNSGAVFEMSESLGKLTEVFSGNGGFEWKGKDPRMEDSFGTLAVTHEHGTTVGWQFVKGRDFSRKLSSDSSGIVINEAALKYMKLKDPIGETVSWTMDGKKLMDYTILGVIKNMVMESPYDPVQPTIFFVKGHAGVNWINIKIKPGTSPAEALPKIEAVFKRIVPTAPFDYKFADEEYASKFAAEDRIGKLATLFASLAILISCLGLFGLASFVAEQRTKEIGIRKVLGASVANLWQMLSRDFVVLVVISCLLSAPLTYYFMQKWLMNYNYRTGIPWWIFAVSAAGALGITLLTVSFQAIRAALVNPVKSLKSE